MKYRIGIVLVIVVLIGVLSTIEVGASVDYRDFGSKIILNQPRVL